MATSRRQASSAAGYILLEAILALAVFSGIAAYQIRQQRDDLLESAAKAHGQEMSRISLAANRYILENLNALRNDSGIVGVANTLAPTLAELSALGFLPPDYGAAPMFGGAYAIALRRVFNNLDVSRDDCVSAGAGCQVIGVLITTQPVQIDGQRSVKVIGRASEEIGVDSGVTGLGTLGNGVIEGLGNWQDNVPAGVEAKPGLIGIQLGRWDRPLLNDDYLRRDGTRPMFGNLIMGNQNINDVNDVNAKNNVNAQGKVTTAGNVEAGGNLFANDVNVRQDVIATRNVRADGKIIDGALVGGNVWAADSVSAGVSVAAQESIGIWDKNGPRAYMSKDGTIYVGHVTNIGWGCGPIGALGRLADGRLLYCKNNGKESIWTLTSGSFDGKEFDRNGNSEDECGSFSEERTCPAGSYMVGYRAWVTDDNINSCSVRCRYAN